MHWHKIVAQILLIFFISTSLAAPVVVREACDACVNGMDIGEGVYAVSWKRADEGGDPLGLTQASRIGPSDSDPWPTWLQESKLTSTSEHEDGSFDLHPLSDSDHESMVVHGASSPKQIFTQADWQSLFRDRPWWGRRLPLSPVSSTVSEDSGQAELTLAVHALPPMSGHESDTDQRLTEGHLSSNPGSWTTSDDGSMTSDDALMEVHEATSPRLPLTQSDQWSMSTNPPSSPAYSISSDHESTDYHTGTSEFQSSLSDSELSNFHSASSKFHLSSDNYLTSGESHSSPNPDDHQADGHWTTNMRMTSFEEPKPMSYFSKLVSKLKFWRRISGTANGAVNAAQREMQGITVDTKVYVSISSPSHKHSNFIFGFMIFLTASISPALSANDGLNRRGTGKQ
jgi:hypothetical protein